MAKETVVGLLVIVILMFLFWGEPDVFDMLRDATMKYLENKP